MTSETAEDLVRGYLENQGVDSTARYLTQGRAHQNLSDIALQESWVTAFKSMLIDYSQVDLLVDLSSELSLRGLGISQGLAAKDLLDLAGKVAQMGPFSEEAEAELSEDVAAYARAKTANPN